MQENILLIGPGITVSGALLRSRIEVHDGSVSIRVPVLVFLASSIIDLIFIFFLLDDYDIKSSADIHTGLLSAWEVNFDFVCNELFIDVDLSFEISSIVLVLSGVEKNSFFIVFPDISVQVINSDFVHDILFLSIVAPT